MDTTPPPNGKGNPPPTAACPWGLSQTPTAATYRTLGIELTIDCAAVASNDPLSFKYTEENLKKNLAILDAAAEIFRSSAYKPSTIALGIYTTHDVQRNLLQMGVGSDEKKEAIVHYLETLLRLMPLERDEFGGKVRFNYSEIKVGRNRDGQRVDIGASFMFAPPQEFIDRDIAAVKAAKADIVALQDYFPDIVLFHGARDAQFQLNTWGGSYYFSSDSTPEQNAQYFDYLKGQKALLSPPLHVEVSIVRLLSTRYQADFAKTTLLMNSALEIAPIFASLKIQDVIFRARQNTGMDEETRVNLYYNAEMKDMKRLVISNVLAPDGRSAVATRLIQECLIAQDYSKSFSVKCPAPPRE